MESIRVKAHAKINLGLDVLGRREDGYHEVRMVMQTIGIYDNILVTKIPEEEIRITSNLTFLPVNEDNLVYKAVKALKERTGFKGSVKIDLHKFIPVSAGMAGGSTDCASVLYAVNVLYGLKLSLKELLSIGAKLGADVPYCLLRGTALAEGIGEKLRRLPDCPQMPLLIAKPPISVSTKMVYEKLDSLETVEHPDIDGICKAIEEGNVLKIASKLGNVLEDVTIPMYPVIDKIKKDMYEHGAIAAMMSGSGPTVFGIFKTPEDAARCQAYLREQKDAHQVYTTEIYNVPGRQKGTRIER